MFHTTSITTTDGVPFSGRANLTQFTRSLLPLGLWKVGLWKVGILQEFMLGAPCWLVVA